MFSLRIEFPIAFALRALTAMTVVSGVFVLAGMHTRALRTGMLVGLACVIARTTRFIRARAIPPMRRRAHGAAVACTAATIAGLLILAAAGTTAAIRSPWSVVPSAFGIVLAIAVAATAILAFRNEATARFGVIAVLLLGSAVAILVYRLGFGFDRFIHVAAERIILADGGLAPIPLFYSGYYGLVTLLATIPGVSVDLADRLVVPIAASVLLPLLLDRALAAMRRSDGARGDARPIGRVALLGALALLIVPFLPLAVSTPQALANVFALATVLSLITGERWTAALTALAALLSQPMTGIIAIAVVAMACTWHRGWRIMTAAIATLGAASIPLAFAIAGRIVPNLDLHIAFDPLPALQHLIVALRDTFAITAVDFATADALAVARVLLPILWVGLTAVGAMHLVARKPEEHHSLIRANRRIVRGTLILAPIVSLVAAALVAATVTVPTQLAEEQSQFPLRLVQLAALLAVPLAAIGLGTLLDRIRATALLPACAVVFATLAATNVALAYPRDDGQARSGLWSVSASDIAAVHAIADDAGVTPYVVLANQMLGAAAIREFSFRPAHKRCVTSPHPPSPPLSAYGESVGGGPEGGGETISFSPSRGEGERLVPRSSGSEVGEGVGQPCTEVLAFPLPAGGPVAARFWQFEGANPVTRAPVDDAMAFINAQRAYVVLHDYWRNAPRLGQQTAAIADGELTPIPHLRIFRFERRS